MRLGRACIVLLAFAGACSTYAPHEPAGDAGAEAGSNDAGGATDAADSGDAPFASDGAAEGDAGCPSCTRYVFLTSLAQPGNVGVMGADAFCNERASVAIGPGSVLVGRTFVAWLSSSSSLASSRLTHGTGPYVRVDGMKVANDYAGLTSGALLAAIDVDETGAQPMNAVIAWTGTQADGSLATATCNDWTDATSVPVGATGNPNATITSWSASGEQSCSLFARLYCIEK